MLYIEKEDISLTYHLLHKFLGDKYFETWKSIKDVLGTSALKRPDLIEGKKINFDTFFANISKILPRSEKYLVKYVKMSCLVRNSGKEFSASVLESIKAGVSESESKRDVTKKEISELNLLNQSWEKLDEEVKGNLLDKSWEKVDEAVFRILEEYKYFDPRGSRLISSIFGEMQNKTSNQNDIANARLEEIKKLKCQEQDQLIDLVSGMFEIENYGGILQLVEQGQWKFEDYPDIKHPNYTIKQNLDERILDLADESRSSLPITTLNANIFVAEGGLVEESNQTVACFSLSSATFFGTQYEAGSSGAVQSNNDRHLEGEGFNRLLGGTS